MKIIGGFYSANIIYEFNQNILDSLPEVVLVLIINKMLKDKNCKLLYPHQIL